MWPADQQFGLYWKLIYTLQKLRDLARDFRVARNGDPGHTHRLRETVD